MESSNLLVIHKEGCAISISRSSLIETKVEEKSVVFRLTGSEQRLGPFESNSCAIQVFTKIVRAIASSASILDLSHGVHDPKRTLQLSGRSTRPATTKIADDFQCRFPISFVDAQEHTDGDCVIQPNAIMEFFQFGALFWTAVITTNAKNGAYWHLFWDVLDPNGVPIPGASFDAASPIMDSVGKTYVWQFGLKVNALEPDEVFQQIGGWRWTGKCIGEL
jgi:hypothetical protein